MRYIALILSIFVVLVCSASQSETKLSGRVVDAITGADIQGAAVQIRGVKNSGAITNTDGEFTVLVVGDHFRVSVSYPGYNNNVFYIKGTDFQTVRMNRDDFMSYESTVLGKTRQQQTTSADAIVLSQQDFTGVESVEQLLQGRIAGLRVGMNSGMPGESGDIIIRSKRSFSASSAPLIVLDGIIVENFYADSENISNYVSSVLGSIDINDIERITVLRSGTAFYGAKGSAGVVVIETQRPIEAETTVRLTAGFGVNFKPKTMPLLDASQHKELLYEQMQGSGMTIADINSKYPWMSGDPSYVYSKKYGNNSMWQDEIFRAGTTQNYHLMVKGGDAIAKYAFSLGYTGRNSTLESVDYERYNIRLNADLKIARRLNLLTNIAYTVTESNVADDMRNMKSSLLGSALVKSPLFHPKMIDYDGIVFPRNDDVDPLGMVNPAAIRDVVDNTLMGNDFRGSAKLVYELTRDINISHTIGVNYYKLRANRFVPYSGIGGFDEGNRMSGRYVNEFFGVYNDTRFALSKVFNVLHNLNVNAGFRVSTSAKEQDGYKDFALANDEYKTSSTGAAATSGIDKKYVLGVNNVWNWMGYYLQADYSYKNRYIAEAGLSSELSSKFSKNHKWQYLPFVSGAVRLTTFDLFAADWLNELKFSAGWEVSGNDDIGCYTARGFYAPGMYRGFGSLVRVNSANDDIRNERTRQLNASLDFAAFNNRFTLSATYYNTTTDNILVEAITPETEGSKVLYLTSGEISDRGFELATSGRILNGSSLKWDIGANISLPRSEVRSVGGAELNGYSINRASYAPGSFFGYLADGVYANSEDASQMKDSKGKTLTGGDMRYTDIRSDGIINGNDMTVIGNPAPGFFGGINTTVSYKNITLSALVDFSYGNDIFNYARMVSESMKDFSNQSLAVSRRWMSEGQQTDIPRAVYGEHSNNVFSSRWIEDGSFIRLRNITLSYDLKFDRHLENIKIFLSADNFFTFTKYLGYSPEVGLSGVDYGRIPVTKSVVLGVKIGF